MRGTDNDIQKLQEEKAKATSRTCESSKSGSIQENCKSLSKE